MRLRVRQVDRVGFARDQADQALVGAQHGLVHRLLLEALGGVKLERAVHAQHVDGADLRHHVGGDQHHDLVQAFLRADRLRHHLAKPAQQHARTAERATHGESLGPAHRAAAVVASGNVSAGPGRRDGSIRKPYSECGMQPQAKAADAQLPGITCRNPPAGRPKSIAIEERGIELAHEARREAAIRGSMPAADGARTAARQWPRRPAHPRALRARRR